MRLRKLLGLSLLEVIFALTIFVMAMICMMSVWVTHARAIELGQDQEVAINLSQMLMEQSLNQGFAVQNVTSQPFVVQRFLRGQTLTSTFDYTISVYNATSPQPPSPGHRVVVVKVGWYDSTANHSISLESNASW